VLSPPLQFWVTFCDPHWVPEVDGISWIRLSEVSAMYRFPPPCTIPPGLFSGACVAGSPSPVFVARPSRV